MPITVSLVERNPLYWLEETQPLWLVPRHQCGKKCLMNFLFMYPTSLEEKGLFYFFTFTILWFLLLLLENREHLSSSWPRPASMCPIFTICWCVALLIWLLFRSWDCCIFYVSDVPKAFRFFLLQWEIVEWDPFMNVMLQIEADKKTAAQDR